MKRFLSPTILKDVVDRASMWSSSSADPEPTTPSSPFAAFPDIPGKCNYCRTRYKVSDVGEYDTDFCGPMCAELALNGPPPGTSSSSSSSSSKQCTLLGCKNKVYDGGEFCSEAHAKRAVTSGQATGCATCLVMPRLEGSNYCSDDCDRKGALRRQPPPPPAKPAPPAPPSSSSSSFSETTEAVRSRFEKRWDDPRSSSTPKIYRVQEIALSNLYKARWETCLNKLSAVGGHSIKSTFWGGYCGCQLASDEQRVGPCKSVYCRVCQVIRLAFDKPPDADIDLADGLYGQGIYTRTNPADAHAHARANNGRGVRVVIACSVAIPTGIPGPGPTSHIDETGRVFCPSPDFIIPRFVIVYSAKAVNDSNGSSARMPGAMPSVQASPQFLPHSTSRASTPRRASANRRLDPDSDLDEPTTSPTVTRSLPRPAPSPAPENNADAKDRTIAQLRAELRRKDAELKDEKAKRREAEAQKREAEAQLRLLREMVDAKERQAANRNSVQERQNPTGNGRLPPVFADLPPVGRTRPRSNSLPGAVNHEPIARPLPPVPPPAPGPNRRPMPGGMDGMYDDSDDDPVINNNDDEDFGMSPYGPRFDRRRSNTTTGRGRGGGQRMRQDRYRDDYDRSFDSPRMGGGRRPPPPDLPEFPPEPDFSGLPEYPGGHFRPVWRDGPFPGLWVPPPPPRPLFNQPTGVGSPKCRIPECMAPPYQRGAEYCNLAHRKEAVRRGLAPPCILCKENPKSLYQFCGQRCQDRAYKDAPLLLPIDKKDPKFNDIANQFNISWRHTNKQLPAVVHIYKVVMTKALMDSYDTYRKAVEKEGNFVSQRRSPGNECRRWHGTKRACTVGDDPKKLALCQQTTCALCSILRLSFLVTKTGSAGRTFNRFGIGVYATSTSSKSDDYQYNLCTSNYKVIMLTTVVVGRGEKLTQNNTSLAAPSKGYHSVLGETGKALNFDEVVVYNNDAIRPAWLVVYQ